MNRGMMYRHGSREEETAEHIAVQDRAHQAQEDCTSAKCKILQLTEMEIDYSLVRGYMLKE